jgi:hypothetical protein
MLLSAATFTVCFLDCSDTFSNKTPHKGQWMLVWVTTVALKYVFCYNVVFKHPVALIVYHLLTYISILNATYFISCI